MATERQSPDALLVQTNLDGAVTDVDDDPDSPDGLWLTEQDDGDDTIMRVSFPTPTGDPTTGADLQEFKIWCRRSTTAGGNDPTLDIALYESGSINGSNLATGVSITSTTGQLVTVTFDATRLVTASGENVELHCIGQRSGGAPGDRRTVEFGAVEWNVDFTVATTTNQDAFRFYIEDGTPASATAEELEDTNGTFDDHERFQLRIGLIAATGDPAGEIYELWAQKNGAGGYSEVTELTDIRVYLSPNFAHDLATTDRLTGPVGTFTAGRAAESDVTLTATNMASGQNTELVWNLLMKRKNANNDFWDFEVRKAGGGALDAYTIRPRVTMNRRAAELGSMVVKLSTATGAGTTRTAGMATIANSAALNVIGEDVEVRVHYLPTTFSPPTGEDRYFIANHYDTVADERAYAVSVDEFEAVGDVSINVSEAGTGDDAGDGPAAGGADDTEIQIRATFEGDNGASNHVMTVFSRTASIDPDTLDDGGSWGAAKGTITATPVITTIHPSTSAFVAFGDHANGAGLYLDSEMMRLMVWEGVAATGRLVVDIPFFDRAYRAPEATTDDLWINQGEAPGIVTMVGTHVTGWDWIAATTVFFQTVAVTVTGTTVRTVEVAKELAVTATGTPVRTVQVGKEIGVAVIGTPVVAQVLTFLQGVAVTVTGSVAVTTVITFAQAAAVTVTGTVASVKQVGKQIAATVTGTPTRQVLVSKRVNTTVIGTPVLQTAVQTVQAITVTVTAAVGLVKEIAVIRDVNVLGTVNRIVQIARSSSVTVIGSASVDPEATFDQTVSTTVTGGVVGSQVFQAGGPILPELPYLGIRIIGGMIAAMRFRRR